MNRLNGSYLLVLSLESIEDAANLEGRYLHDFLTGVFGLEDEVSLAEEAILDAFLSTGALPRVLELFDRIADKGDEPYPLTEELIMKN